MIAEIGAVHLGSMDRAGLLIKLASNSGADYVKSQKRNVTESLSNEQRAAPHPNPEFAYGSTYGEHREKLELTIEQHCELQVYCKELGMEYGISVWDITSAREVVDVLQPAFIKIPSPCNTWYDLIEYVYSSWDGEVHISLGMTTASERRQIMDFISPWLSRTVVYHCVSSYPCKFEDLHMLEIPQLCSDISSRSAEVISSRHHVGFSNHGYGIAADIAAYMLGARWIERHFVDDRTLKHTDAALSLEPGGLQKLCRDLRNVRKGLTHKGDNICTPEVIYREKLRRMDIERPD